MKNFGKIGKDKITNFEGVITAKCFYIFGCAQYCLTPRIDKDGKRQNIEWFDEGRIEIFNEVIKPESVQVEENGCETRDYPN